MRELRQNLSVWLRRVEAGAAFRVTDRGRPVALLGPLPVDDDPLAPYVAAGVVSPAEDATAPLPPRVVPAGGPASDDVLRQMRDEERF